MLILHHVGLRPSAHLPDITSHRAYFAGFGAPFTLATFFVPNFVSKGIFALLFPVVSRQLVNFRCQDADLHGYVYCSSCC